MQNSRLIKGLSIGLLAAFAASASAQTDIARWNFTAAVSAPDNTPAATTDKTTASATQEGMTNSYNGGNTASCDVLSTGGDPNPVSTGYTWRVRGASNNGWALAAPEYTQGAQFLVSTIGYKDISFSFDLYCTTQGIADLQLQYTTNGTTWTNFQGSYNGNQKTYKDSSGDTELVSTSNNYNTVGTNVKTNTVDLSGIAGVANDANFGVRLVSAFAADGKYDSAAGGVYNNTSGNWRFDQIAVQGTAAVPELPSSAFFAIGGVALLVTRRRRK